MTLLHFLASTFCLFGNMYLKYDCVTHLITCIRSPRVVDDRQKHRLSQLLQMKVVDVQELPWEQRKLTFRERLNDTVELNGVNTLIDVTQALLSIASILLYIWQTYSEGCSVSEEQLFRQIEIGFGKACDNY